MTRALECSVSYATPGNTFHEWQKRVKADNFSPVVGRGEFRLQILALHGAIGGHNEREQTLNQILAEMDGFDPHESVVVMAATNRPDVLDAALTRPGRFDRQITLDLPQKRARYHILRLHTENVPLAGDVDLQNLAARTVGFTGAELKNLVNEAALLPGRRAKQQVDGDDFDQARDKIMLGSQRDEPLTEGEKHIVAYHEAGHALLARLLPGADPLQKRYRSFPAAGRQQDNGKPLFAWPATLLPSDETRRT